MIGLLLESILLILNAIAILNEKRFLKKYGFDTSSAQPNSPNDVVTSKSQIIMMIFTLRSVGKCKYKQLLRCTYSFEFNGNFTIDSQLMIYIVILLNIFFIMHLQNNFEILKILLLFQLEINFPRSKQKLLNNIFTAKAIEKSSMRKKAQYWEEEISKLHSDQYIFHPKNQFVSTYIKCSQLREKLVEKEIYKLFPIQWMTYPAIYQGFDIIGRDKTGSGKTLAYSLPVLSKLYFRGCFHSSNKNQKGCKFLILLPTRQLAIQVATQVDSLRNSQMQFKALAVYGGVPIRDQIRALKNGIDVIAATPGRLKDLIERGQLKLQKIKTICLDQIDEMLAKGFKQDIQNLLQVINQKAQQKPQLLFFSATIPQWVLELSKNYQKQDLKIIDLIQSSKQSKIPNSILHFKKQIKFKKDKTQFLKDIVNKLIKKNSYERVLIFCERIVDVEDISDNLFLNIRKGVLHSKIKQSIRERTINAFQDGKIRCIVATNVASRGIDFIDVGLVINFSPPNHSEVYVHRAGRTGRAGKRGVCITLYTRQQERQMDRIQYQTRALIESYEQKEQQITNLFFPAKRYMLKREFKNPEKLLMTNIPAGISQKDLTNFLKNNEIIGLVNILHNSTSNTACALIQVDGKEAEQKLLCMNNTMFDTNKIKVQCWLQE